MEVSGALQMKFRTIHGMKHTPEYSAWCAMKRRCYNPRNNQYHNYGARGVKVCDRWMSSFPSFLEDMGERPGPSFSLDRIDNNGNYEKENCRWANDTVQSHNTRPRKNRTGLPGVKFRTLAKTKQWEAVIRMDGKQRSLGYFLTPEEAHHKYSETKKKLLREALAAMREKPTNEVDRLGIEGDET
jgi:hypothetical protein